MHIHVWTINLVLAFFGQGAPTLPPVDGEVMSGAPAAPGVTRSKQYTDVHPEERVAFDQHMGRLQALDGLYPPDKPLTVERASSLIGELYHDTDSARLNYRWQDAILGVIMRAACRPDISDEARGVMESGLMDFWAAGGAQGAYGSPDLELQLGKSLIAVGGDRRDCCVAADDLIQRAGTWAEELGNADCTYRVDHAGKQIAAIEKRLQAAGRPVLRSALRSAGNGNLDAVLQRLEAPQPTPADVEMATRTIGTAASDDATVRLLVLYRQLLERHRVPHDTVRAIDSSLLRMAREAAVLRTERHWALWSSAVGSLGPRATSEIRREIRAGIRREDNVIARRAFQRAEDALRFRSRTRHVDQSDPHVPSTVASQPIRPS